LDPLWGTMGQVIPLFERRGILLLMAAKLVH
jgi:hypothetical protein